jgi:hypothetical protein
MTAAELTNARALIMENVGSIRRGADRPDSGRAGFRENEGFGMMRA